MQFTHAVVEEAKIPGLLLCNDMAEVENWFWISDILHRNNMGFKIGPYNLKKSAY